MDRGFFGEQPMQTELAENVFGGLLTVVLDMALICQRDLDNPAIAWPRAHHLRPSDTLQIHYTPNPNFVFSFFFFCNDCT